MTNVGWMKSTRIDPYKVRIHLKEPFPAALEYLAGPTPSIRTSITRRRARRAWHSTDRHRAYAVESLEPGKSVVFVKNANYWRGSARGKPRIGKVVERFIPEKTRRSQRS
jgi:peptide/nickel transport system substrate-binding protein